MKADDLFEAIGNVDGDMLLHAKSPQTKKIFRKKTAWISAIAAMLVLSLILGSFLLPGSKPEIPHVPTTETTKSPSTESPNSPTTEPPELQITPSNAFALAEAIYPDDVPYPVDDLSEDYFELFTAWEKHNSAQRQEFNELNVNIEAFLYRSIGEFLSSNQEENVVFSPLNVYMAFAMLAEITDNNSRQQILDVLGCENIETLRKEASALWNANYSDDGLVTSILASSFWLSDRYTYKKETLQKLADIYYASSFSGEMGSEEYDKALQTWLNEQTGGLLKDSAEKIEMNPKTIMGLATTIYFKANWTDAFSVNKTVKDVFHTPSGDITCNFMKQSMRESCYFGEQFTAVKKGLGNGAMWLILPHEGISPENLLANEEAMTFLTTNQKQKNTKEAMVHLSIPKFDVSSDLDLREGMKNLGITDVFDEALSNYSPMTDDCDNIVVASADHSARVTIDEEGCTAAAFTVILNYPTAGVPDRLDEITFTLDRPFLFVITSDVGLPLFVGTVNQPN